MAPSPSPEVLDALFELADLGVREGLAGRPWPAVDVTALAPSLRERTGAFVTLEVAGELNGCIGTIEATEPLGAAVARLAWAAAFDDPRLPALTVDDYRELEFKLSLLSALEPLPAASESELVAALRPGVDGLVIRAGRAQGTFLPAVWEKLPDPLTFVRHLEDKAGLRPGRWPAGLRAWRYTAAEHRRRASDIARASSPAADRSPSFPGPAR
jgi:AmmeMemoRadiSam system protein A